MKSTNVEQISTGIMLVAYGQKDFPKSMSQVSFYYFKSKMG
jgi:hypothetical protein